MCLRAVVQRKNGRRKYFSTAVARTKDIHGDVGRRGAKNLLNYSVAGPEPSPGRGFRNSLAAWASAENGIFYYYCKLKKFTLA